MQSCAGFFAFFNSCEGWWKGVKQFFPIKSAEHEETPVCYSNSEISHLRPREVPTMLQTESTGTLWAMFFIYIYIYVYE